MNQQDWREVALDWLDAHVCGGDAYQECAHATVELLRSEQYSVQITRYVQGERLEEVERLTQQILSTAPACVDEPEQNQAETIPEPNSSHTSESPEQPAATKRGSRAKSPAWRAAMAKLGEEKRRKREEAKAAAEAEDERASAELLQASVEQASESPALQDATARVVRAKKRDPQPDAAEPAGDVVEALRMAREMVAAEVAGGLKEGGGPIALRVSRACNISVMTAGDLVEEAVRARNEARCGRRNAA